ncbi:MAG: PD-(D/E)XK nuclease family protein [Muribaculaceae bacterium]|nr:PD-(D/E)XK nuclease family protein [Muribaculaceae bacterium]
MKKSFLRQVAQYFQAKPAIHDYCFVMPNHRSCKFLERELDLASNGVYLMPQVMTITDFLSSLTDRVPVKPVDALFLLYQCYTSIAGNENYEFDKFIYWGNVVLNDFNDVDMYLVDPEMLFKNVKEHREIQSNYLDGDIQEIVSHYFNLSVEGVAADNEDFWRNYNSDGADEDGVKAKYLKLWQSLYQLYEKYNRALEERGLCTIGRMYRDAVDTVKERDFKSNEKFVFVGFNMLTTCELAIFKRLKQQGRAQFFWDLASAAFANDEGINNGSRFVKFFRQEFPEPSDFSIETVTGFPEIEVVGVPSNVGQAKYCYQLLNELIDNGVLNSTDAINTALVLPDDGLLVPLLNSLPPEIKKNVTMGYPHSSSDIASLMRVVAKMHHQARRNAEGEWTFYRGDVKIVLSHTIIKNYFGDEALELRRVIAEKGLFAVPQSIFTGTKLELLFTTVDHTDDTDSVNKQLKQYVDFCQMVIDSMKSSQGENIGDEDNDYADSGQPVMTLQEAFLNQHIEVLNQLMDALSRYQVPPCESSVFYLIDRLAAAFSIPFEGEPLQGLQIMGMLETRCLDFENIIILSANEGMMPGKTRRNSFISDFMRSNYAMSTAADQEMMWNYNFYRLIGRAKRLIMIYDTSDQAMGSGEATRYVSQLELVYGCDVKRRMFTISSATIDPITIEVPKRDYALKQLEKFLSGKGDKTLSASSIKEYINCPLMFYFNKIERLRASDDDVDFMDAGTFGSIVHDTLQHLYYPLVGDKPRTGDYYVTSADITRFIKEKLDSVIETLVNETYLRNSGSGMLVGEASIVSVAIKNYVMAALNYDIALLDKIGPDASFTVLECECKHNISLNYGGVDFNFTYIADRIDRLPDGTLRIVDYKTGRDDTSFTSVEDLFAVTTKDKNLRGVLQLMLYCNAYALEKNTDAPIMPVIYKLRNMDETGVINNNTQLEDYHTINDKFKEKMDERIGTLFDTATPFKPSPDNNSCRFCRYIDFCRRNTQG